MSKIQSRQWRTNRGGEIGSRPAYPNSVTQEGYGGEGGEDVVLVGGEVLRRWPSGIKAARSTARWKKHDDALETVRWERRMR